MWLKVTLYSASDLKVTFFQIAIPSRGVKKTEWTGLCEGPMIFFCTDTTDTQISLASAACVAFAGDLTVAALNSFQWSEQALCPPGALAKVGALLFSLRTEGGVLSPSEVSWRPKVLPC